MERPTKATLWREPRCWRQKGRPDIQLCQKCRPTRRKKKRQKKQGKNLGVERGKIVCRTGYTKEAFKKTRGGGGQQKSQRERTKTTREKVRESGNRTRQIARQQKKFGKVPRNRSGPTSLPWRQAKRKKTKGGEEHKPAGLVICAAPAREHGIGREPCFTR